MKITNHHELRRRVTIDCSHPVITDQSSKNLCDINNIMATYQKTGMLPHFNQIEPKFQDNTNIPSLEDSFNAVRAATEQFYELPATLRKLMDNNPQNLESFIQNPANEKYLIEHGLIVPRKEPPKTEIQELTEELKKMTKSVEKNSNGGKNDGFNH